MTLANVLLGIAIGFPMMIAVGPISVLLLDQGLERGIRAAAPAVAGVAAADLSLSVVASVAGATISAVLAPVSMWLAIAAVTVLAVLAVDLARSALGGLRAASSTVAPAALPDRDRPVALVAPAVRVAPGVSVAPAVRVSPGVSVVHRRWAPAGVGFCGAAGVDPDEATAAGAVEDDARASLLGHLAGARLAGAFYGLTMVNPLTLVLFASVVVAGGTGVGSAGWAVGMALASLLAHGGFVVLGGAVRTTLGPVANARLRLGAAVFMAGLALYFMAGL